MSYGVRERAPEGEQAGGLKLLIELAPLIVFFFVYARYDMRTAAGALAVATVLSVVAAWFLLRKVSTMLWVTTAIAVAAATLTYVFDEPRFIKMKPTIVNLLFAGVLGVGLATGKPLLKLLLGESLKLRDEGWKRLTMRWVGFFLAMAALNEVVWRTMSEAAWVNFKVFAILPLTIAFTLAQIPLMSRYAETQAER